MCCINLENISKSQKEYGGCGLCVCGRGGLSPTGEKRRKGGQWAHIVEA